MKDEFVCSTWNNYADAGVRSIGKIGISLKFYDTICLVGDWRRLFSIATKSKDIAAGVTPDILDAWPTVSGLILLNFSRTSVEKPVTVL